MQRSTIARDTEILENLHEHSMAEVIEAMERIESHHQRLNEQIDGLFGLNPAVQSAKECYLRLYFKDNSTMVISRKCKAPYDPVCVTGLLVNLHKTMGPARNSRFLWARESYLRGGSRGAIVIGVTIKPDPAVPIADCMQCRYLEYDTYESLRVEQRFPPVADALARHLISYTPESEFCVLYMIDDGRDFWGFYCLTERGPFTQQPETGKKKKRNKKKKK